MLDGKRILITGVLTRDSIAYAVADAAQRAGAEVVLTGFGRGRRITERAARGLAGPPEVLELDVTSSADFERLATELGDRWDSLDGVLHAVAHAPPEALGGNFTGASPEAAQLAFRASAFSLKELVAALLPLLERRGGSVVSLTFDSSLVWPSYDWMGVAKAALESVSRYLAVDLGRLGIRVNSIASGPLRTPAAEGIPGFDLLTERWTQSAPLGWEPSDPSAVADAACFLLSDRARAISGEILHVDGGFHALGVAGGTSGSA